MEGCTGVESAAEEFEVGPVQVVTKDEFKALQELASAGLGDWL